MTDGPERPRTPLRVLQVDKFLRRVGGAAAYMLDLSDHLRARGHQVDFFSVQHPDNLPTPLSDRFPPDTPYDPPPAGIVPRAAASADLIWSVGAARAMADVLDRVRPDIVHLHNIYHQLSPSILRPIRRRGIPMVMTLHDFKLICPTYRMHDGRGPCEACLGGGFHHAVRRRCKSGSLTQSALLAAETALHRRLGAYDPVDVFICPSEFLRHKLIAAGFSAERLRHIPNFTAVPTGPATGNRGDAVVSVGRLSAEKGIDTLIEACARPPARNLRIAGDGPLRPDLEARAAALAPRTTRFLGQLDRPAILAELDRARCAAFPARGYENMPVAILEAMARGVPVVVTDIGGSPELVEPGPSGLCVPPEDPVALRAAIDRIDDEALATRLGASGRSRVATTYAPDTHLGVIEGLYDQLLASARAVRGSGSVQT